MNKIVLSLLFCCVMQAQLIAQTKAPKGFKVNVGVLMAIPASNLKFSTVGAGVDVQAQYGFSNALVVTSSVGYTGLAGEGFYPYTAVIPITVGLRYYPIAKLYAAGKLGWGVYSLSSTTINYTAYTLGAAYEISKKWDSGVYYDGFINDKTSFGYVALRVGYTF
jgi:hypothetical protein